MSNKLQNFIIVRSIALFITPYIILYAIYIQLYGEVSAGGGFQAGVIFASCLIAIDLIHAELLKKYFSTSVLIITATIGISIYFVTGIISLIFNDNYLNYASLSSDSIVGQHRGIFTVELGIGLTVASVMHLIYSQLNNE
ncbi:MAG: Na(+)/H(+) antiporter subunit B [Rickettsiaceae bacterium]